jgi:hypothetical protein
MITLVPPRTMVVKKLHPAASSSHAAAIHSSWPSMAEKCREY